MVGMDLIISRFPTPLNSSRTMGSVRWRDENLLGKEQNVRADSSAKGQEERDKHRHHRPEAYPIVGRNINRRNKNRVFNRYR